MKQLSGESIVAAVSTAHDAKNFAAAASDRMRELASAYVELQGVCVGLAEALESCLDHGSMTGDEWVSDKARAALARYRGE